MVTTELLVGNAMLEVNALGHCATGSGQNGNEDVTRAASETLSRWLNH